MKPFVVAMPMECATRRSGGISVDDCAKTEILVCAFGADSERAPVSLELFIFILQR